MRADGFRLPQWHTSRLGTARAKKRHGFTVLELLTTIGVVGTLAALILPAVGSARESARRLQCINNLKQVGLAMHGYHDQHKSLPPGWQSESSEQSAYGWAVSLLPHLEQASVYRQVNARRPITHSVNSTACRDSLAILLCASDITEPSFTLYYEDEISGSASPVIDLPTANYLGVFGTVEPDDEDDDSLISGNGTFVAERGTRFAELRRGLSNTLVVGERTMKRLPSTWLGVDFCGEDAVLRLVGVALTSANSDLGEDGKPEECEFTSRHPGGANFLWGDGHVRFVSETISPEEYRRLAKRTEF